jgi:hypothetical protein
MQIAILKSGTHSAIPRDMVGQRNAQVGRHPQQLALALGEWVTVEGQHVHAIPNTSTRDRRSRDARGRLVAGVAGAVKSRRLRALPSRDSRGRFVAYPTSDAPSWYVFCCDGYRIPDDRPAPPPLIVPAAPRALPRAIARPQRAWLTRSYLENAILFLLFVTAMAWYLWHLPPPRWQCARRDRARREPTPSGERAMSARAQAEQRGACAARRRRCLGDQAILGSPRPSPRCHRLPRTIRSRSPAGSLSRPRAFSGGEAHESGPRSS